MCVGWKSQQQCGAPESETSDGFSLLAMIAAFLAGGLIMGGNGNGSRSNPGARKRK